MHSLWIWTFPWAAQLFSTSTALSSGQVTATAVLSKISQFLCHFFLVQTKLLISSSSANITLLGYTIYNPHIHNYITLDFHAVSFGSPYHSNPVSSPLFTFSENYWGFLSSVQVYILFWYSLFYAMNPLSNLLLKSLLSQS